MSKHDRISEIADLGFAIVRFSQADAEPEALASEEVDLSSFADDPVCDWIRNHLGTGVISTESHSEATKFGPNATVFAALHGGDRYGGVFVHTNPELSPEDVHDLEAATLLLASNHHSATAPELAPRELAYLQKAANGDSDDKIAEEVNLSMRSVKERKKRCIEELGARNLSHAILVAKKAGLI